MLIIIISSDEAPSLRIESFAIFTRRLHKIMSQLVLVLTTRAQTHGHQKYSLVRLMKCLSFLFVFLKIWMIQKRQIFVQYFVIRKSLFQTLQCNIVNGIKQSKYNLEFFVFIQVTIYVMRCPITVHSFLGPCPLLF